MTTPAEEAQPQFEGDTGTLTAAQRACLRTLLRTHYISEESHPDMWAELLQSSDVLLSRLHDLYIDLHIDRNRRLAYKTHVEGDHPSLLRRHTAKRDATLVLIYLRGQYLAHSGSGSRVVVDEDSVVAYVQSHGPAEVPDETAARRAVVNALDGLAKSRVVKRIPDDAARYQVLPVIESLITAARLEELQAQLSPETPEEDQ